MLKCIQMFIIYSINCLFVWVVSLQITLGTLVIGMWAPPALSPGKRFRQTFLARSSEWYAGLCFIQYSKSKGPLRARRICNAYSSSTLSRVAQFGPQRSEDQQNSCGPRGQVGCTAVLSRCEAVLSGLSRCGDELNL